MGNVYIFSGLGADERVFQQLDFSDYRAVFIKWIEPQKRESIEHYAKRLIGQITSDKPVLIGLSFGGIMAVEVAKQINTEKLILIATAKTRNEIPFYYRLAGRLGLHKIMPAKLLKSSNFLTNWFFGVSSTFDRKLLRQILSETDSKFLKWAIDKIVHWKNHTLPENYIHIHGANDRILPVKFITCDVKINGGGHLMVLNHFEELNEILKQQLL
jgi:pimeloyl-ACP methyl ester carboxylesterase